MQAARVARACALAVLVCAACSGGSDRGGLDVAPASVQLDAGGEVQFQVRTAGATALTWAVEGVPGGSAELGTIDASGRYRAPAVVRAPVTVSCAGKLGALLDARGTATVTFPAPAVVVSPTATALYAGEALRFTAAVTGSVDQAVHWSATQGTIDADGTFRAAAAPTLGVAVITATSAASGAEGSATVQLAARPPVLTGITATADAVHVEGTGFAGDLLVFFPSPVGPLQARATSTSSTAFDAPVPAGAGSGPLRVQLVVGPLTSAESNAVDFTRRPRLRLHADQQDVASGSATPLQVAWLGASAPEAVAFTADLGRVEEGQYLAPEVTETAYAHVRACLASDDASCATTVLAVRPFTVSPAPALVRPGGSVTLQASAGGPVAAAWTVLAGGGAVSPAGVYTASAAPEDAGITWLEATIGGVSAPVQVGVTGVHPGLVGRAAEHHDPAAPQPGGGFAEAVAVDGDRAYVLAGEAIASWPDRSHLWIDVYDVADPAAPRWLGAVESATRPDRLLVANGQLLALGGMDPAGQQSWYGWLTVYDLSGPLPRLSGRTGLGALRWALDGERLFGFGPGYPVTDVQVEVLGLSPAGPVEDRQTSLPLPAEADPGQVVGATAAGDRAYLAFRTFDAAGRVAVYDLSAEPPALLGTASPASGAGELAVVGGVLAVTGAGGTSLLDRSGDTLVERALLPQGLRLLGATADRLALLSEMGNALVVDVADPAAPRNVGALHVSLPLGGALLGNHLYLAEGLAGLAIYDVGPAGGPRSLDRLPMGSSAFGDLPAPSALLCSGPYLHAGGTASDGTGWVATYDASANDASATPPALLAVTEVPWPVLGLARSGDLLLAVSWEGLALLDVSAPAAARLTSTLQRSNEGAALDGTTLLLTAGFQVLQYDVSDPALPVMRGVVSLEGYGYVSAFGLAGPGVVALTRSTGDLDLLDAATLARLGTVALGGATSALAVGGSAIFLTGDQGLTIVDASDPAAPQLLGTIPMERLVPFHGYYGTPGSALPAVDGPTLWLAAATSDALLVGYDVRTPAAPRLVSGLAAAAAFNDWPTALTVDGRGHAYLATALGGIGRLDIGHPRNVVLDPAVERSIPQP